MIFHWGPRAKGGSELQGHRTIQMFCLLFSGPGNGDAEPGGERRAGLAAGAAMGSVCTQLPAPHSGRRNSARCLPLERKTEETGQ